MHRESEIVADLPAPDAAILSRARSEPASRALHDGLAEALPALRLIEQVAPPHPAVVARRIRVAAWNAERGNHRESAVALLRGAGADVALLSELDIGMARSANRHCLRELAGALDAGYLFATEFVELGLGDARERARCAGQHNAVALHGNAILSRHRLADPVRIALDDGGLWFDGARNGERRIGGRMALAARLAEAEPALWLVSLHLESHSDPENRAEQIERLARAIDRIAPGGRVIVGGDLNTNTLPPEPAALAAAFEGMAAREPLFARFEAAGFDWRAANRAEPTQRMRPDGTPKGPFTRIDWLAARDVAATNPQTIPAVDPAGNAISDHDLIVVDIAL